MFGCVERMIAFRYLRARRQEGIVSIITGFSVLGITLGVATLIIVMAVMNGFRDQLTKQILGFNGHLGVYAYSIVPYDPLVESLKRIPHVKMVTPLVERQAMIIKGNIAQGAMVHGIRAADLRNRSTITEKLVQGSLESFEKDKLVIGARMAEQFGVSLGDTLTLVAPKGSKTAFGVVPRMKRYKIAAIFEIGMHTYDSSALFMPLKAAQKFFQTGEGVTSVEVFIDHPDLVHRVRHEMMHYIPENLHVTDWRQANASFFNALQVERNVMFIILTLIIVIAAFNIISSLIMMVKEKGHDIAILRTMGATRGMIMRIFFLSGASTGFVGTVMGVILGLSFSWNIESIRQWVQALTQTELFSPEIYYLTQLPAVVEPAEVVSVILMALALSFLATLYPSWRASRMDPVEALRYE